jgi:DNA invertase Pin-like site-specific DNA recombinase
MHQIPQITALYCRLSKDDGRDGDSNSIASQKSILLDYAKSHAFYDTEFFIDDGFSGTTFHRPGFARMQQMLEEGRISTVIVKDLSRFGRNYLEVGHYLEIVFPTKGVRFISIQENIDSFSNDTTELVPFSNIFNEWYAAQTSKKIRAVHQQKSKDGKRVGASVPYGYVRDPNNQDIWHIDQTAAEVVRLIFSLFLDGNGTTKIARILQEKCILTPTAYRLQLGMPAHHKLSGDPYLWQGTTVMHILDNIRYTGCTANFMSTRISYKVRKKILNDKEDWVIIPDTQPAIIDSHTYDRVQQLRQNRHRCTKTGKTSMFSGLVYCADCKSKLQFCSIRKSGSIYGYFRCSQYKSGRGKCTSHYISQNVLTKIVTESIQRLANFISCYEPVFLFLVHKQQAIAQDNAIKLMRHNLDAAKKRIEALDKLMQKVYEDYVFGKISEERCQKMTVAFETEQQELIQCVDANEAKLAAQENNAANLRQLLDMLRTCQTITELTPTMVRTLIDRIEIDDDQLKKKGKTVHVDIYYTAVGLINIPSEEELKVLIEEMQ